MADVLNRVKRTLSKYVDSFEPSSFMLLCYIKILFNLQIKKVKRRFREGEVGALGVEVVYLAPQFYLPEVFVLDVDNFVVPVD